MDGRLALELTAVVALVLLNGFFALAEFSIIASRRARLQTSVRRKQRGAEKAYHLKSRPDEFLATIQVGITLTAALMGVFSGATIVDKLEQGLAALPVELIGRYATSISVAAVVVAITVLSVVLGELVPKYIALSNPERFARWVATPTAAFVRVTSLPARVLSGLAGLAVRLIGIRRGGTGPAVSEEEIQQMLLDGRRSGLFDETEEQFVAAVFRFTDATVRRAMKPRTDVIAVPVDADPADVLALVAEHGYSRYPVYEKNIDHVVGILHVKDFIGVSDQQRGIAVREIMREPLFVPDSMPLPKLLKLFQSGKNHLAIVLDEFGGTAGIVTLEDTLEELVGEILDEYDVEAPPIVRMSDRVVYADGGVHPGEINRLLEASLPEDKADTLAGLFIDTAGRVPDKSESLQIGDTVLTVLARRDNRILRLKVEKAAPVAGHES